MPRPKGSKNGIINTIEISCIFCGNNKKIFPWSLKNGGGKYCSRKCYFTSKSRTNLTKQFIFLPDSTKGVKIPLSKNKFAIIDEEDFNMINQWTWSFNGKYAVRWYWDKKTRTYKFIQMHRFIINCPIKKEVDHINRNGLDNRKINLRICNHSENNRNKGKLISNTSGYIGVHEYKSNKKWVNPIKKWVANITINKKTVSLGYFLTKEEAARAYDKKAKELYGEFAQTNF